MSSTSSSRKRPDNILLPLGKSAKKGFLVEIILDLIEPEGSQDDDVNPILAPIYVRLRDLKNRLFDFQFSLQGLQDVRRVRLGVDVDVWIRLWM